MRLAVLSLLSLLQLQLWAAGSRAEKGGQPDSAVLLARSGGLAATGWLNTSGAYAAIRLAIGDISSHDLQPTESKLQLLEQAPAHGNCSAANVSVVTVLSAVGNNSTVSSTCSSQAQLTHLPVITFSPACLNTEDQSPTDQHFCMLPSPHHLPSGVAALVSFFKWQRVTLISEEDSPLLPKSEEFVTKLTLSGVSDIRQRSVSSEQLPGDLFDRDYRIQILNLTPPLSRTVLCEALHRNLTYVWVLPGWYPHNWWMESPDSSSASTCSDAELEHTLSHSVLSLVQSPTEQLTGLDSPRNYSNFRAWCDSSKITDCEYAGYAYDAVLAVAKALNNSLTTDDDLLKIIANSNFSGVSGQVVFDSEGYRQHGSFKVFQYRNATRVQIGTFELSASEEAGGKLTFHYSNGESEERVWPEGVPLDGSPKLVMRHPILALVVICYTFSTAIILFALVCIIFNICFRKKKLIKLTSPLLNLMIAIGVIMMNIGALMTVYPPIYERELGIICLVRGWLLAIGWSLCLSTIAVKMWRVYIISSTANKFQNLKHKKVKRYLRDWHLTIFIMILVVVDVLVLVVGTSVPAARFTPEKVENKEFPPTRNGEGIQVEYYNLQCVSDKGLIWVALIFGYKVLLQISGMVLAFLTRKVQVKGLNESKEVQLVMIVTTPIVVLGMILRLALSDYLNVVGGTYSIGTVIVTGSALGIIFIPKMVELYKDPTGDHIFLSPYHHDNIGTRNRLASVESNSVVSTGSLQMRFDRSSTLRSIFRSGSVGNKVSSSLPGTFVGQNVTLTKFRSLLPQIEEASNESTVTDDSQNTTNLLIPQNGSAVVLTHMVAQRCMHRSSGTNVDRPVSMDLSSGADVDRPVSVDLSSGTNVNRPVSVGLSSGTTVDRTVSMNLSSGADVDRPVSMNLSGGADVDRLVSMDLSGETSMDRLVSQSSMELSSDADIERLIAKSSLHLNGDIKNCFSNILAHTKTSPVKKTIAILPDEDRTTERGGDTKTPNDHTHLPDHREHNHILHPSLTSTVADEQRQQNEPSSQGAEDKEKNEVVAIMIEELGEIL